MPDRRGDSHSGGIGWFSSRTGDGNYPLLDIRFQTTIVFDSPERETVMRDTFIRRTVACCGLVAVTAAAIVGCSDDKSSSSATSSSVAAATSSAASVASSAASAASSVVSSAANAGATADAATTQAITDVFTKFFDAKTPADQKTALVEKGDAFGPALQAQATNPQSQGLSATVSAVSLADPTHANVTYTLLLNGAPALPNQAGKAIQDGGQWKVAAATFCALVAMQGAPAPACS